LTVIVAVAAVVPFGVSEAGLILQVAFWGAPEQARLTAWLNPPAGVIVIVVVTLLPLLTVPVAGDIPRLKLAGTAVIVTDTAEEVEAAKPPAPA
jgi:hypothetical protein